VAVRDVAVVSEIHAASILRIDPEDGGNMNLQNVGNIAHKYEV
jgi:hypothetical protein